jgi:hypothetical protein
VTTDQPPERPDLDPDEDGRSVMADVASTLAGGAGSVISAARAPIDSLAAGARRLIEDRPGARVRGVRRMGRQPLTNLWDVHPEASRASIRELGLRSVPVELVKGTAVAGAPQRGGDFLPLRDRRSEDWRARWQRILRANEELHSLPPIELIKFGDEYWVVDGHNRVAAALYIGQGEIDAVVDELRLPGMAPTGDTPLIVPVLDGSLDLRAAGAGRLTRTADRPADLSRPRDALTSEDDEGDS